MRESGRRVRHVRHGYLRAMNGQKHDLLIIGGGPAGHSAAHGYRKAGGDGSVRLLSADSEPPYNRPPLSKEYLRGEAQDEDLPIEGPGFYDEHDITVSPRAAVTRLEPRARRVHLSDGRNLGYRNCVVATGAEPVRPPVPGIEHPNVRSCGRLTVGASCANAQRPQRGQPSSGPGSSGARPPFPWRAEDCR